jgi:hypothetical protein
VSELFLSDLFLIGTFLVVLTLVLGGWIMVRWSREQEKRIVAKREREDVLDALTRAGDRALDADPTASLDGLRALGAMHDDKVLEPIDDEYVEEVADTVISRQFHAIPANTTLVLAKETEGDDHREARIVLPHELLAAMLVVDIASNQGREPSELASRIANASPAVDSPDPAEAEPAPLKRSA